jgi:hypothetical protein
MCPLKLRHIGSTLAFASLVLAAKYSAAQDIPGYPNIEDYDVREVAMLPQYCIHTQAFRERVPGGNDPGEIQRWTALMGPAFNGMHHYCWGLMKTNRAVLLAKSKRIRDFYLQSSIEEFDYVLRQAPTDFAMRPEILTKKAQNLFRLGDAAAGEIQIEQAIGMKPDYWPAYVALSDYLKSNGELGRAREWLEKGLAAAPDARALKNRLLDLDKRKPERR